MIRYLAQYKWCCIDSIQRSIKKGQVKCLDKVQCIWCACVCVMCVWYFFFFLTSEKKKKGCKKGPYRTKVGFLYGVGTLLECFFFCGS